MLFLTVPLWELVSKVVCLSIGDLDGGIGTGSLQWGEDCEGYAEVAEDELTAFEAPLEPCLGDVRAIVATPRRMLVAAAQGGRMEQLSIWTGAWDEVWKPFAVRKLLSAWVGIRGNSRVKVWDTCEHHIVWYHLWVVAAFTLRPSLYHMSSLPRNSKSTQSRMLTHSDVQAMHNEFRRNGLPRLSTQTTPTNLQCCQ